MVGACVPAQLNPSVGARSAWTPGREQDGSGCAQSRGSPDRQKTGNETKTTKSGFNVSIESEPNEAEMVEQPNVTELALTV